MTRLIRIALTDAAAGTWSLDGAPVATGCAISEDRDYWQLVDELQPHIESLVSRLELTDAMIEAFDPVYVDPFDCVGPGSVVCQFRILNGTVEAQV